MSGRLVEYRSMFEALRNADAELKIVIAGNHDITLDEKYYNDGYGRFRHAGRREDPTAVREFWCGEGARKAGIVYLDEGVRTFDLKSGARFTVSWKRDSKGCLLRKASLATIIEYSRVLGPLLRSDCTAHLVGILPIEVSLVVLINTVHHDRYILRDDIRINDPKQREL